ncbi:MAG: hypothetical protein P1U78_04895 [Alcanivoracaceae bacterium]|nr:hypothetical protein [Alcanivoracaceae bacterium]
MMDDIKKLSRIISNLESQANQVSEFNGLLSAINAAREEIEASGNALKVASDEHKKFVDDNREAISGLGERVESFDSDFRRFVNAHKDGSSALLARFESVDEVLERSACEQAKIAEKIFASDFLSPQEFHSALGKVEENMLNHLAEVEGRIGVMISQHKRQSMISSVLLFLSVFAVLGAVLFSSGVFQAAKGL